MLVNRKDFSMTPGMNGVNGFNNYYICQQDNTRVVNNNVLRAELKYQKLQELGPGQSEVVSKGNTELAYPGKPVSIKSWEDIRKERRNDAQVNTVQDAITNERAKEDSNIYTVKSGDTLWDIAESCRDTGTCDGKSVPEIINMIREQNEIKGSMIRPGDKIQLPPYADLVAVEDNNVVIEDKTVIADNTVIKNKGTSGDDVQIDHVIGDNNMIKQKGYKGDDYQEAVVKGDNNVIKQKGHEGDDIQYTDIQGNNNIAKQKGHEGDDTQILNAVGDNNTLKQKGHEGDDTQVSMLQGDNNTLKQKAHSGDDNQYTLINGDRNNAKVKAGSGNDLQNTLIYGNNNKVKAKAGNGNDQSINTISGNGNKEKIKLGKGQDIADINFDANSRNNVVTAKGDRYASQGADTYNVNLNGTGNTVNVNVNSTAGYDQKDVLNINYDEAKFGNFNIIRDEYNPQMYVLTTECGNNMINIGNTIGKMFINGHEYRLQF